MQARNRLQETEGEMNGLILQYFGIGDVIFSQAAIQAVRAQRYWERVYWPVRPEWIEGLKRAYPDIHWLDHTTCHVNYTKKNFGTQEMTLDYGGFEIVDSIPLRYADSILGLTYTDCMKAKYSLFNLNWKQWKDGSMFKRDTLSELSLMAYLHIEPGEKFVLVNEYFRQDASGKIELTPALGMRVVQMRQLRHYSIFDWARVIEAATEIHTVSTSIIYILELLGPLKAPISIYIRRPDESSHKNYQYLLKSNDYRLMP